MYTTHRIKRTPGATLGALVGLACCSISAASDLRISAWSWSLPRDPGTGSLTVTVENRSQGGHSGSIGLRLWLSTAPYGQGGTYYTILSENGLAHLTAGYRRTYTISHTVDWSSIPDGTYHIVAVLSE